MPKGKNLDSYKLLESMYEENSKKFRKKYKTKEPVSYTHLTLPTSDLV